MTGWAEVIGDPIAHSLSPLIHGFWLDAMKIRGSYSRQQVGRTELAAYLHRRRVDDLWLGCNVTSPLKEHIVPLLDALDEGAALVGAVNCVTRTASGLTGSNSDLDGVKEALADTSLDGARVMLIGAGGAAKAALTHCLERGARDIVVLARSPERAQRLASLARHRSAMIFRALDAGGGFDGADLIINASPAGMAHADPLPADWLSSLRRLPARTTVFDMVYAPIDTALLSAAREAGLRPVDGLVMLIGQARRAFAGFFGVAPPPAHDAALRAAILARGV